MNKILLLSALLLTANATVVNDLSASAPSRSEHLPGKICSPLWEIPGATYSFECPSIISQKAPIFGTFFYTVYSLESAQDLFEKLKRTEDNSEKKLLGKSLLDIAKVIVEEDDVAMFENIQQCCIETYGARSNYFDALIKCHFSRESWESEVGKKILINEKE